MLNVDKWKRLYTNIVSLCDKKAKNVMEFKPKKKKKKNKEMYLRHILNIWNKREIKQNFFIN